MSCLDFIVSSNFGKGSAKKLRASGSMPAVIMTKASGTICVSLPFSVITSEIAKYTFMNTVFDANISSVGGKAQKMHIAVKSVEYCPKTRKAAHIDFYEIEKNGSVIVPVPISIIGKELSPGIKRGGKLNIVLYSIPLKCNIKSIPNHIEIDISKFGIGRSLFVSSMKLPIGTEMSKDCLVLSIIGRGKQDKEDVEASTAVVAPTPSKSTAKPSNK